MITRDNYEAYFVDYLEGNLPENQMDQFLDFLNQNPDLKEELHLFKAVILPEENVVYNEKQKLHKSTADETHRFENKAIAYLEGDLDENGRKLFESYIASQPKLRKEYNLFAKTKLVPDLSIRFAAKNKLYRKTPGTIAMNWAARAAAIVVLVWGISSLFQTPNKPGITPDKTEVAQVPIANQEKTTVKTDDQAETTIQKNEKSGEKTNPAETMPQNRPARKKAAEKLPIKEEIIPEPRTLLAALPSIDARLETEQELHLAVRQTNNIIPINESSRTVSVEEFLAMQAKKVSKEGLFSAQRLARLGLNIASEISGERIGYKEKNGKITSVEFESKLMAFSIPLEKK